MIKINNGKLCENCFAQIEKEPCPVCGFSKDRYRRDPMALGVGSVLAGRYAIGRVIGKGGFGVTYLAYDMKLECRVAVKEYYPYGLAAREPGSTLVSVSSAEAEGTFKTGAEKFYDEARLVAKFNGNPNIVSVHDFFYENDTVYFTMGYLEGMTLKAYLKEYGALPLEKVLYVAEAVSNALMVTHSMNVLHRDISPDNIMICTDGTIKLLDFGAARQVVTEGSQSLSVILKQGFAPLEQYQKKGKQGPWTDIYSLGATLYHALTLDVLDDPMTRFDEDEEYSSNKHHIEDEFWKMIKKATELRMQDRYQDIFEWKKDLNNLSVKPVPLVEVKDLEEKGKFGKTAKAFGDTVHTALGNEAAKEADTVGVTMPLQEEDAVGVTMPLREEESVGVTMPLLEEDTVGVTMPLREEESAGVTMPLQEEDTVGMTVPLREEENVGAAVPLREEDTFGVTASLQEDETVNKIVSTKGEEAHDSNQVEETVEKTKGAGQSDKKKKWIVGAAAVVVVVLLAVINGKKLFNRNIIMEEPLAYMDEEEIENMGMDEFDAKLSMVFGNSEFYRSQVKKITFLNSKKGIPKDAWDVSKIHNGTVMAWIEGGDHLYIAANGSIIILSARGLFYGYVNLEEIEFNHCVDTSMATDMGLMFYGCSSLTSLDVSDLNTSQVTDMSGMFNGCSGLTSLDVSSFDTSQVTDMSDMFYKCESLIGLDVSGFDTSQATDMSGMFNYCIGLSSLDVSGFDTSQVTDMSNMFCDCWSLVGLDVSGFDTSRVTSMDGMFGGCGGLSSLDVSGFDTSQVTDMEEMFSHCSGLSSLDVSGFDTSRVTTMRRMFRYCSGLSSLDVSGFDTSQVTDMEEMFRSCKGLSSLDVSDFDTSQVTNMNGMFCDCETLSSLDVRGFDTSQVTDMSDMFSYCSGLSSLDVSGFDISQVTNRIQMFFDAGITAEEAGLSH